MEDDDLTKDILSAMNGESTAAPVETVVEPVETAPAEVTPPTEPTEPKLDATGRAHAPDGKFTTKAQKEAAAAEAAAGTAPPAATEAAPAKLMPPASWAPEAKAAFLEAPEHVQKAILKRHDEMETGQKEWSGKAEDYNRINKVIEPMRGKWAMQGLSPEVAIGQLVSAANLLQSNPREGFEHLLKTYAGDRYLHLINEIAVKNGYALTRANSQDEQPPQGQPPAQADTTVRRLEEQVRELAQWKQAREQTERTSSQSSLMADIASVENDPKNLYYGNVKKEVAIIAQQMKDDGDTRPIREIVQAAYDQAVWANEQTRPLMLQAQQKTQAEAARKAEAARVAAARNAAVSITGSPGSGAPAAPRNGSKVANQDDDLRADIMAAMSGARA